jgi:hypothetical protein
MAVLERAVTEYDRAPEIHDLVWCQRPAVAEKIGKVAVLAEHRALKTPPAAG